MKNEMNDNRRIGSMNEAAIGELFYQGKILGAGQRGQARLVTIPSGRKYVAKAFDSAEKKELEENKHIEIWKRMKCSLECENCKNYMFRPIKSKHPSISLHVTHPTDKVVKYTYLPSRLALDPSLALKWGVTTVKELAALQLAEALQCFHQHGVAHGNVHLSNVLIAYDTNVDPQKAATMKDVVVTRMQLKLIDFDASLFATDVRPLVTVRNNNSLNATGLSELIGNTTVPRGTFTNLAYVQPHSQQGRDSERKLKKIFEKVAGNAPTFHLIYSKTAIRKRNRARAKNKCPRGQTSPR